MQFVKGNPPETQYATRPRARAKRREFALVRLGFESGRVCAWLSLRPSQGQCIRHSLLHRRFAEEGLVVWKVCEPLTTARIIELCGAVVQDRLQRQTGRARLLLHLRRCGR
jgi:hypothetical protein